MICAKDAALVFLADQSRMSEAMRKYQPMFSCCVCLGVGEVQRSQDQWQG
jgi:hypothetical protein